MTDTLITTADLEAQADDLCAELAAGDPLEVFNDHVLDFAATVGADGTLQSFTIVTGTGGPHVEFTIDGRASAWWTGFWGSDRPEGRHYSEQYEYLFDMLAEYMHGVRIGR